MIVANNMTFVNDEEQHLPLVKRLMFTLGDCEICANYSLMSQIKQL